jgi:hypothetical protein
LKLHPTGKFTGVGKATTVLLGKENLGAASNLEHATATGDKPNRVWHPRLLELSRQTGDMENAAEALQVAPRQAERPVERPAPAPAPVEQPRQVDPRTSDWVGRNTWFNPAAADYDPEMRTYAESVGTQINLRLARNGKQNEIGGPGYWMEIDRHMRTEFPDAFEDVAPTQRAVPPMSRDATVAPVNRGGAPAAGAPSSRTVRLTAEERSFAHQMARNGAFAKAGGGRLTDAEAERHYAAQKLKTGA